MPWVSSRSRIHSLRGEIVGRLIWNSIAIVGILTVSLIADKII